MPISTDFFYDTATFSSAGLKAWLIICIQTPPFGLWSDLCDAGCQWHPVRRDAQLMGMLFFYRGHTQLMGMLSFYRGYTQLMGMLSIGDINPRSWPHAVSSRLVSKRCVAPTRCLCEHLHPADLARSSPAAPLDDRCLHFHL